LRTDIPAGAAKAWLVRLVAAQWLCWACYTEGVRWLGLCGGLLLVACGGSGAADVARDDSDAPTEPADVCFPSGETACAPAATWNVIFSEPSVQEAFGEQLTVTQDEEGNWHSTWPLGDSAPLVRVDDGCRLVLTAQHDWTDEGENEGGHAERALIADLRGGYGRGFLVEEDTTSGQIVHAVRLLAEGLEAPDACVAAPPAPGALAEPPPEECALDHEWRIHREVAPSTECQNPAMGLEVWDGDRGIDTNALRLVAAPGTCRFYAELGSLAAAAGTLELRNRLVLDTVAETAQVLMPAPCTAAGQLPAAQANRNTPWQLELVDEPASPDGSVGEPLFGVEIRSVGQRLRPWDMRLETFVRSAPDAALDCAFRDEDEDGWVSNGDAFSCLNGESGLGNDDLGSTTDVTLRQYLVDGGEADVRPRLQWLVE
jgi:hypothetical protein